MINRYLTFTFLFLLTFILVQLGCKNKQETNKAPDQPKRIDQSKQKGDQTSPSGTETDIKYILFYGNSLTAGYGLDEEESFPSLVQDRIDSLKLKYRVINAGLSGETTAGGLGRINWVLNQPIDIFILELGGNDMLRGLDVLETEKNLRQIVNHVREKYPDIPIILCGMQAAPNMGADYANVFNEIYSNLAKELDLGLIPFLLQDVGGMKALNQPDGIHPNVEGAAIVRDNVWKVLKDYL